MTSLSPFLRDTLKVSPTDSDLVEVTVTLPPDLFVHYIQLLESLSGFFHFVNRKSKYLQARSAAASHEYAEEAQRRITAYRSHLVKRFDHYTGQGLDRKSAVKQIAAELRAEKHPWCAPELVRSSLVAAGRGGKAGRPRRKS